MMRDQVEKAAARKYELVIKLNRAGIERSVLISDQLQYKRGKKPRVTASRSAPAAKPSDDKVANVPADIDDVATEDYDAHIGQISSPGDEEREEQIDDPNSDKDAVRSDEEEDSDNRWKTTPVKKGKPPVPSSSEPDIQESDSDKSPRKAKRGVKRTKKVKYQASPEKKSEQVINS